MRRFLLFLLVTRALSAQSATRPDVVRDESKTTAQSFTEQDIREAIGRAMPPIEKSAAAFVNKRACVSCHHNFLPILLADFAESRGIRFDAAVLKAVEAKTFRSLRGPKALDDAIQGATLNDPTPNDSFLLISAHAAGTAPDAVTAALAQRLINWQRDGHWVTSDFRPPHSSSYFTATASAVRAIREYAPQERDCIARARQWLVRTKPASTEDAAFRVMGLVWAGAPKNELASAGRDLLAMRNESGAWPQLRGYPADAYSTGESLFALHEAGLSTPEPAYRFLLTTQAGDGTWRVHTRMLSPAEVSPPYFTTGFPYGKDEYLSYAGSVWATMALLSHLPGAPPGHEVMVTATATPELKDTLRFAAMRGDLTAVRKFLAAGAEPSAEALSQAVTFGYPDIVKTLIDAGASARVTEKSGINLLHWAAIANRPAVIPLLVRAGAAINAKDENEYTPLMYAATIDFGDRAVWNALLKAGADPNIRNADGRTATEQAKLFLKSRN
jgi:hypothetical protein